MSESMPCGHEKTAAVMLGQPCPYCVTEGKVEGGLVINTCGCQIGGSPRTWETHGGVCRMCEQTIERTPVTPTADVRELVEALQATAQQHHLTLAGSAGHARQHTGFEDCPAPICRAAQDALARFTAKHPTYGGQDA